MEEDTVGKRGSEALYKSGIRLAVLVLDAIVDDGGDDGGDDSSRNYYPLLMILELRDIQECSDEP